MSEHHTQSTESHSFNWRAVNGCLVALPDFLPCLFFLISYLFHHVKKNTRFMVNVK